MRTETHPTTVTKDNAKQAGSEVLLSGPWDPESRQYDTSKIRRIVITQTKSTRTTPTPDAVFLTARYLNLFEDFRVALACRRPIW